MLGCYRKYLLGISHGAHFPDDGDFNLAGVLHLLLDFLRDFEAQLGGALVGHVLGIHHHAQFAAGLNGEALVHAFEVVGRFFELLEALDVAFHHLAAGAGARARDGIAGLHERRNHGRHLNFVVVGTDSVHHVGVLFPLLGHLHAQNGVGQLGLLSAHLADVVEQAGALGFLHVEAHLGGHGGAEVGHFAAVLQQVLPVGGAEAHAAHHLNQLGVQAVNAEVDDGFLADFDDFLLDILARLSHNLLHAGRVNAAVLHQQMQRQTGNFAAHRVKARDDDGLGRVVHNDFHAGSGFQGADVAAFATDDFAFNVVALDVEYRHAVLDGVLRSGALNGFEHNLLGVLGGREAGLGHGVLDVGAGLNLGFVLERLHQLLAGFGGGEVGDGFELALHSVQLVVGFFLLGFQFGQGGFVVEAALFGLAFELVAQLLGVGLVFLALALEVGFLFLQLFELALGGFGEQLDALLLLKHALAAFAQLLVEGLLEPAAFLLKLVAQVLELVLALLQPLVGLLDFLVAETVAFLLRFAQDLLGAGLGLALVVLPGFTG